MEFTIWNRLCRLFGPAKAYRAVAVAVQQQHRGRISCQFRKHVRVPDVERISAAHADPAAEHVERRRHPLRTAEALTQVGDDIQRRIQQHHGGDLAAAAAPGKRRDRAALRSAHQNDPRGIDERPGLRGIQNSLQIGNLRHHGHFCVGAVAAVAFAHSAAAKIEAVDGDPRAGQQLGIADARFVRAAEFMGKNHERQGLLRRFGQIGHAPDVLFPVPAADLPGAEWLCLCPHTPVLRFAVLSICHHCITPRARMQARRDIKNASAAEKRLQSPIIIAIIFYYDPVFRQRAAERTEGQG